MPGRDVGVVEAELFLVDRLGADVTGVEFAGEGYWSRCFGFRRGDRELVIRFGKHREDFDCDRRAAAWRSPALPVPEVLEVGDAFDGSFAISERVRGEPLELLDADGWRAVLPGLFAALAAVRSIPRPGDGGYGPWDGRGHGDFPTWRAYLLSVADDPPASRTHGWRPLLDEHHRASSAFVAGLSRLQVLADAGEGHRHVVHSDLLNRNVFVIDGRITGICDWGCALDGDPVAEWAELEMWAPWHPGLAALDIRTQARAHLDATGMDVVDFDARMLAALIRTALLHLAYNAFIGEAQYLESTLTRLEQFLDS